jgi:urease accessory protein
LRRPAGIACLAVALPGAAQAHDAFGDLGPFYQGLLHPLVDPSQGLALAAVAVLLARQPLAAVRTAFAVLACAALAAALLHPFLPVSVLSVQLAGVLGVAAGLAALSGLAVPVILLAAFGAGVALLAAMAGDTPSGLRASALTAGGTALGITLFVLLLWGAVDLLQSRLGRVAGAVAGSWIAAIGLMVAVLPA